MASGQYAHFALRWIESPKTIHTLCIVGWPGGVTSHHKIIRCKASMLMQICAGRPFLSNINITSSPWRQRSTQKPCGLCLRNIFSSRERQVCLSLYIQLISDAIVANAVSHLLCNGAHIIAPSYPGYNRDNSTRALTPNVATLTLNVTSFVTSPFGMTLYQITKFRENRLHGSARTAIFGGRRKKLTITMKVQS